jgi:hypothetical protein
MRRGAAVLAALGAALLVLAAVVTTATSLPILRGTAPKDSGRGSEQSPTLPPPVTQKPPKKQPADQGLGIDITIVMYVMLILLLIALAFLLARSVVIRRRRRRPRPASAEPEPGDDEWGLAAPEGLARSAARGLTALTEGSPRNAIVQCWTELEDAVERLGLPRDPALTSEEFTAGVLERYAVGRSEIETLGALYREARFSAHPMTERHRAAAVDALTELRDELRLAAAATIVDLPAETTEQR